MLCLLPTKHLCFDTRNIALRRSIYCMVEGCGTVRSVYIAICIAPRTNIHDYKSIFVGTSKESLFIGELSLDRLVKTLLKVLRICQNTEWNVLFQGNKTFGVFPYAREGYENLLKSVLLSTKKISWNKLPMVQGILPRHTKIVESVIKEKNYVPKLYVDTTLQYLDLEKVSTYEIR